MVSCYHCYNLGSSMTTIQHRAHSLLLNNVLPMSFLATLLGVLIAAGGQNISVHEGEWHSGSSFCPCHATVQRQQPTPFGTHLLPRISELAIDKDVTQKGYIHMPTFRQQHLKDWYYCRSPGLNYLPHMRNFYLLHIHTDFQRDVCLLLSLKNFKFFVTTNCRMLTFCMNVNYVVGHERVKSFVLVYLVCSVLLVFTTF